MKLHTVATLNRLNTGFYEEQAEQFSSTRQNPWPGWERVAAHLSARDPGSKVGSPLIHILDVGCGNGRFGVFLQGQIPDSFHYVGFDSSRRLLDLARARLHETGVQRLDLRQLDVVSEDMHPAVGEKCWDLITVFGMMHHIPGLERRQGFLRTLVGGLKQNGILALSFWQFGGQERFQSRIVPWREHNRDHSDPVDESDLEPGDHLLAWGSGPEGDQMGLQARRYCHFATPDEAQAMVDSLGVQAHHRYFADGHDEASNLYYILELTG